MIETTDRKRPTRAAAAKKAEAEKSKKTAAPKSEKAPKKDAPTKSKAAPATTPVFTLQAGEVSAYDALTARDTEEKAAFEKRSEWCVAKGSGF